MRIQASKTQIFGYLWHLLLFSNAFFNTQMWQKAKEYICPQVGLSSTAQVIVTGKIRRVLHVRFECLFWPIKCMHLNPDFGTLWPLFCFLNAFSKAVIWHKEEEYVLN